MKEESENKGFRPSSNKGQTMVKVKINHNREIKGVGKSDEVVMVAELDARMYVTAGLATIVKEN